MARSLEDIGRVGSSLAPLDCEGTATAGTSTLDYASGELSPRVSRMWEKRVESQPFRAKANATAAKNAKETLRRSLRSLAFVAAVAFASLRLHLRVVIGPGFFEPVRQLRHGPVAAAEHKNPRHCRAKSTNRPDERLHPFSFVRVAGQRLFTVHHSG